MDFFTQAVLLSAAAVLVVQQLLKLNFIPVGFANHYPVPTNIVLSVVAAVVASWKTALALHGLWSWISYVGLVSVAAAIAYNQLLSRWVQLKAAEGDGKA